PQNRSSPDGQISDLFTISRALWAPLRVLKRSADCGDLRVKACLQFIHLAMAGALEHQHADTGVYLLAGVEQLGIDASLGFRSCSWLRIFHVPKRDPSVAIRSHRSDTGGRFSAPCSSKRENGRGK